jgi:hypothetical protein
MFNSLFTVTFRSIYVVRIVIEWDSKSRNWIWAWFMLDSFPQYPLSIRFSDSRYTSPETKSKSVTNPFYAHSHSSNDGLINQIYKNALKSWTNINLFQNSEAFYVVFCCYSVNWNERILLCEIHNMQRLQEDYEERVNINRLCQSDIWVRWSLYSLWKNVRHWFLQHFPQTILRYLILHSPFEHV